MPGVPTFSQVATFVESPLPHRGALSGALPVPNPADLHSGAAFLPHLPPGKISFDIWESVGPRWRAPPFARCALRKNARAFSGMARLLRLVAYDAYSAKSSKNARDIGYRWHAAPGAGPRHPPGGPHHLRPSSRPSSLHTDRAHPTRRSSSRLWARHQPHPSGAPIPQRQLQEPRTTPARPICRRHHP